MATKSQKILDDVNALIRDYDSEMETDKGVLIMYGYVALMVHRDDHASSWPPWLWGLFAGLLWSFVIIIWVRDAVHNR